MANEPPEGSPEREYLPSGSRPGEFGQRPHERSPVIAQNVELYAMWGLTNQQVAGIAGIGETTLKRYYQPELTAGRSKGVKIAGGKLFTKVLEGNLTAIIFYLKSKGGFQERQAHQLLDSDGEPIDLNHISLGNLSDELIHALRDFLAAAVAGIGPSAHGEGRGRDWSAGEEEDRARGRPN